MSSYKSTYLELPKEPECDVTPKQDLPIWQLTNQLEKAVSSMQSALEALDSRLEKVRRPSPSGIETDKPPTYGESTLACRLSATVNHLEELNRFAERITDELEL